MNLRCSVRKQASGNTLASLSQCRAETHTEHFKKSVSSTELFMKGQTNQVPDTELDQGRLATEKNAMWGGSLWKLLQRNLSLWRASLCFSCGGEEKPSCISSYLGQKSEPLRLFLLSFPLLVTPTCGLYCFRVSVLLCFFLGSAFPHHESRSPNLSPHPL